MISHFSTAVIIPEDNWVMCRYCLREENVSQGFYIHSNWPLNINTTKERLLWTFKNRKNIAPVSTFWELF